MAADIEKALTINQDGQQVQEWLELANGDSGVNAIESLMERRGAFDYILLETTGLADPGNIAPIFWVDDGLGSSIYLDGIVTVVDAKNIMKNLDDRGAISANEGTGQLPVGLSPTDAKSFKADDGSCVTTAHLQISHADVIIVNKADLVSESVLREIQERVRSINSLAKIHTTHHSRIPRLEEVLLDIHAYDQVDRRTLDDVATKGRSVSKLDPTISTIKVVLPRLQHSQLEQVDAWLRSVLWETRLPPVPFTTLSSPEDGQLVNDFEIHRVKGLIYVDNDATSSRMYGSADGSKTDTLSVKMIQGVRDVFEMTTVPHVLDHDEGSTRQGKMVLIGRGLSDAAVWQRSLDNFLLVR
ncbi:MAG: hypothetical protein M1815_001540 [Lichina confinis]|nr:MAG: hypothetical protein M1815_001540 [Lichina confinis]